jgi:hypothetical protein
VDVRARLAVTGAALLLFLVPAASAAQSVGRLPPFVFDLRGFWPTMGRDPVTAKGLNVDALTLPAHGLGGQAGIHLYPVRRGRFALGIGGDGIFARAKAQEKGTTGTPVGLAVHQELKGLFGNISLNFGDNNGWSYVTAGMGPTVFKTYLGETVPNAIAPSKMTINMGGGARWFMNDHLAATFDLRFYLLRPEVATEAFPPRQRYRLLALSGGIAIK